MDRSVFLPLNACKAKVENVDIREGEKAPSTQEPEQQPQRVDSYRRGNQQKQDSCSHMNFSPYKIFCTPR